MLHVTCTMWQVNSTENELQQQAINDSRVILRQSYDSYFISSETIAKILDLRKLHLHLAQKF